MPWTRDDADHLLRRAGFGGSLDDVDRIFALGQTGAIDALVNYESTPDPIWSTDAPFPINALVDAYGTRLNLLYQMYSSTRPFQAKLMWFWHGLLTTSYLASDIGPFRTHLATYRANVKSPFVDLLTATYKSASMLLYLNGNGSNKFGPNQNFARECMELFTIGRSAPYTETDVIEAARAFTGWYVNWPDSTVGFDWNQWDSGPKTILGQTAAFNGDSLVAMLAARPETAGRIPWKLYLYFINETVNWTDHGTLVTTWKSSGGNLGAVVNAMLSAPFFWDPVNRYTLFKTPLDFAFGLMKRFETDLDRARLVEVVDAISGIGYAVFNPVNVSGYRPATQLTGTTNLLSRYQFAAKVINDWTSPATIAKFNAGLVAPVAPATLITTVAARMGCMPLRANTMVVLQSYLQNTPIADADLTQRTYDVAFLVACTAEYQML